MSASNPSTTGPGIITGGYVISSSNGLGTPPVTFDTTATIEPINSTLPMVTQTSNSSGSRSSTNTANEHLRRIQEMHFKSSIPSTLPLTSTPQQHTTQQATPQQPMFYQNAAVISVIPSQAEIRGRVRRINPRSPQNSTIFWVWTEKLKREFKCRANFFCPVREGDAISGIVQFSDLNNKQEELVFIQPPFVEIGMDKDSVSRTFLKFLRGTGFGNTKSYKLYDRFAEIARASETLAQEQSGISFGNRGSGSSEQVNLPDNVDNNYNIEGMVCNLISEMAEVWNATEDESTLVPITTAITTDQAKKLMTNWYKQCNLRRLYLLGLNNREIRECHCSCDEIYRKCLENPFTVVQISMDKCHTIWDRIGKKYTKEQERCGLIARRLYENSDRKSWTGTPSKILASNFEDCSQRIPEMKADYDIMTEMFTVYLPYQYEVETAVSRKIMEWAKNSPLPDELGDQKSSNKIDDPNFLKTTLDESQKEAIRGALINSISIITGVAGSGKCLDPTTPVLMYDGSIKTAGNIVPNDKLMGPDSKPRCVINTCIGEDEMFEIVPSKGRPFKCNKPHVLTLKGIVPRIHYRKDRNTYVVTHTVRGLRKTSSFKTEDEAIAFKNMINEDIFDIPLNEYLGRTSNQQRYNYLYHTSVDFEKKDVPMDPYLIGCWLGDGHSGQTRITNIDPEILEKCDELLDQYNLILKQTTEEITYQIVGKDEHYYSSNAFAKALKCLDLINNKHIPHIYKVNDRDTRLKVLAGLLDTDGYLAMGYYEITQNKEVLARDIEYLALSLGFMVTFKEVQKSCTYKEEKRIGTYYRVNIFGDGLEDIPVVLERKKAGPRVINKRATCINFNVTPLGRGNYAGFELDGDGRFLLGDFTVTHNTTVIGEVIYNLELMEIPYMVASFTGKAVARIREVIKRKTPATMHRLIAKAGSVPPFKYLIIDEASMVTADLFYEFGKTFKWDFRVLFVGDPNQLQPIGWGDLFSQMISSGLVPTYSLNTNHRSDTDGTNGIKINSEGLIRYRQSIKTQGNPHENNEYEEPFSFSMAPNFSILEGNMDNVFGIIRAMYQRQVDSSRLTIITPYNRDLRELNSTYQQIYNDGKPSIIDCKGQVWMVGDRVMMKDNNYEINVMNGEEGIVRDILDDGEDEEAPKIVIEFEDGAHHKFNTIYKDEDYGESPTDTYKLKKVLTVKQLQHSFAVTVHKSQGSEWDFVIIYVPPNFNTVTSFLNANLVYTSITRARRAVWMIGDITSYNSSAIVSPPYRCDNLAERMKQISQSND